MATKSTLQKRVVTISLENCSGCNLNCRYCFAAQKHRQPQKMSYESAVKAIDFFLDYYRKQSPPPQEYCVDFTGTGEPLLNFELIERLAEYVIARKNDKIFLHFTTNGTLLTPGLIARIKKLNKRRRRLIRFSLTFDGFPLLNDINRRDRSGRGSGDRVLRLIGELKEQKAFSLIDNANSTFTYDDPLLTYRLKGLYLLGFRRIIVKPYRGSDRRFKLTADRLKKVKKEYRALTDFILKKIIKENDYGYFFSLFNPGDYLGKFLLRTYAGAEQTRRCPAGLDYFYVDAGGDIFLCPSFSRLPETSLGNVVKGIKNPPPAAQAGFLAKCEKCAAKKLCGGQCYYETVRSRSTEPARLLCELKKFLIKEAAYFWGRLYQEKSLAISYINRQIKKNYSFCFE
ncbi:MAG: radical SAM protein [Candidatus Margulisiibacteriota bacterium]|jgi:uncharacterized protein